MAGVTMPSSLEPTTFTFLLPLWNSPVAFLDEQLAAIAGQTHPHWECIVVDDASTDVRGIELAERRAQDDGRFRTVRRSTNGGIAAATNDAIEQARTDWLVFCDHDDRVHVGALATIAAAIDHNPDADLVYSDEQVIDTAGAVIETYRKPDLSPERLLGHNYFNHLVAVRRSFVESIGGLNPEFAPCPDREFTLRASRSARRIVHVPEILYDWRSLPGSVALAVDEKPGVAQAVTEAARRHLAAAETATADITVSSVPGDAASARVEWSPPSPAPEIDRIVLTSSTTAADIDAALRACAGRFSLLLPDDAAPPSAAAIDALAAQCARSTVVAVGPRVVTDDARIVSVGRTVAPFLRDLHQGREAEFTGRWGEYEVAREVASVHPYGLMLDREATLQLGGFDAAAVIAANDLGEPPSPTANDALAAPEGVGLTVAVLGLAARKAGTPLLWTPLAELTVAARGLPIDGELDVVISAQHELARSVPEMFEDPFSPQGVTRITPRPADPPGAASEGPAVRRRALELGNRAKGALVRQLDLGRIAHRADVGADGVEALRPVVHRLWQRLAQLADVVHREQSPRLAELERWQRVERATEWARVAPLRVEPLVSVVMPTRNRADLVATAIESVRAQRYTNWELVVVDDGSTDSTPSLLAELHDERIHRHRTAGIGAAAARNVGLQHASGDWVAFCDDDNAMHPAWLRGVAEFVGRQPDASAVYGAQLREDGPTPLASPWLLFEEPLDLDRLTRNNSIDLGVLAARRDHPELHFDEHLGRLAMYDDWEMIVRIARHGPLAPLPVIASAYSLRGSARLSERHDDETLAEIRRRFALGSTD